MIKANELRIGNYVNVEFQHIPILNGQEIDFGHAVQMPIPITPEILEKCGFSAKTVPSYYEGQSGEIHSILIGPAKCRFMFVAQLHKHSASWAAYVTEKIEDANKFSQMISTVSYLHRLQNLYFALTQTELTYNP